MTSELVFTATFNEAPNIASWISQTVANRPESDVLVIDDNSPDGTSEIVSNVRKASPQVRLITREKKEGLKSAHLLAMKIAFEAGYSRLVTLDADLSHQPSQISRLVTCLPQGGFAVGTRCRGGSHEGHLGRRTLSRGANRLAQVLLPTGLSEYTSSMRVYSRDALAVLNSTPFHYRGYAFFIEVIEVLHRAGIPMSETPIDFLDRGGGSSKIPRSQIFVSSYALAHMSLKRVTNFFAP